MPSTLAPNRLGDSSRRILSREVRPPRLGEVTLSQELRTARSPRPHVLVGYRWSHTGLRPGRKVITGTSVASCRTSHGSGRALQPYGSSYHELVRDGSLTESAAPSRTRRRDRRRFVYMVMGLDVPAMFPFNGVMTWHPLPSTGFLGMVPPLQRYYGMLRLPAVHLAPFEFSLADTIVSSFLRSPRSWASDRGSGSCRFRYPQPACRWKRQGLPGSWKPSWSFAVLFDPGRIGRPRPTTPRWDTNRLIALLELPGFARFATTREILSMPGKTAKVTITERQHDILRTIQNAPTASSQLRQRAAIILLAFDRQGNPQIAAQVGLSRRQVSLWRRRWADAWDRLIRIECLESHAALRRAIEQVLRDEPRSGPPGKFTPEQIVQILAVACEPPEKSGRPITHWTAHELADEVVKRGIVPSISVAQVGRYLREAALQPHKKRYWLNTTEKDPVQFQKQVEAVCDTYLEAPALEKDHRTHTVSSDEMTGIQALERNAPSRPMTFGQCEKIEFEYTRHGTLTLIGNFQVTTGELIAPTIGPTRTEADFASHIEQTVATDPSASWIFVVDNLNIHCSETLVRKVAQACGIEQPLGKKGVRGVLKSVASRQAFLSEKSHRIRFVYTPKHSSWLNQIETIFGMIMRKVIRRGSFTSVADLRSKLLNFIAYFNRVFAKPFQWTYTGRPLRAKPAA